MNEITNAEKGLALVNTLNAKVQSLQGEVEPKFEYRIDYLFSASRFVAEVVSETPDEVYTEVRQYINDTITNLQYCVYNTEDAERLEKYKHALDCFLEIDTELKNNNL